VPFHIYTRRVIPARQEAARHRQRPRMSSSTNAYKTYSYDNFMPSAGTLS
jgi:hypothetical protein